MPPMTSRRAGAREIRVEPCQFSSSLILFKRAGTGSAEKRGAGGGLGGGGNFFLAFEDDAIKKPSAGGGAENGRQHVGFCFVDLGKGKLESVSAAGAVPSRPLILQRGNRPN